MFPSTEVDQPDPGTPQVCRIFWACRENQFTALAAPEKLTGSKFRPI
jgi:hypothetical protein